MTTTPKYPHIEVELIGGDGNAFAIIGSVHKAIRRSEGPVLADEFMSEALSAESYDDLLRLVMSTVEVA